MEIVDLHLNIDYVGSSGIILTPEQKAALQSSLLIQKHNYQFKHCYFWGKIVCIKDDYFIIQGIERDDEFSERKTLYSKDCVKWGLLPPATDAKRQQAKLAKGRFTGDPAYEFEHIEIKKIGENEDQTEEEEQILVKEEDRLSAVITEIDVEARLVPRGSFMRLPTGEVKQNRSFEGLSVSESAKLCNYLHFREPERLYEKSLLQRASMDKGVDFMDPIDEDVPKGCWSLQFERGSGLVTLRNLLWPGYVFYHVPGSAVYGSVYVGSGERNLDLPFML